MCAVDTPPGKNISIHALREEGDATAGAGARNKANFYPRPPRGGRPVAAPKGRLYYLFLSTPSARRATINVHVTVIHNRISIHALREEGDTTTLLICQEVFLFLSTPSARRATCYDMAGVVQRPISIHALREEGDLDNLTPKTGGADFYPRPPRGGRPLLWRSAASYLLSISIHALREEGDNCAPPPCLLVRYFYPRPPRGGRRS